MTFTNHTMQDIIHILQLQLKTQNTITFQVINPDLSEGYAGEEIIVDKVAYKYRGYKSWSDLAEILNTRMLTPIISQKHLVLLSFKSLTQVSFHKNKEQDKKEKYGISSEFSKIQKMEEPAFLYYYQQALENINISQRTKVLNLGVNRADEFEVIENMLTKSKNINFVGIDHSQTAIAFAKNRFAKSNFTFYATDINDLDSLNLDKFDVLISIGTLQSPSINFKPFFMKLVQNYLEKNSAIILGFPNSRWRDGEMIYGAKAPHYAMSEMSLLYSDVIFCKKYLQQHKYRVTLTGKQYIFLTATKIV